jgi:hypothetical protein
LIQIAYKIFHQLCGRHQNMANLGRERRANIINGINAVKQNGPQATYDAKTAT